MKPRFVSFHYTVKNKTGKVLDSSHNGEPMMFLEGANQILPVLEAGIKGLRVGDKKQILIQANDAYGVRDEQLVMEVPLTELPNADKIKEGSQFKLDQKNDAPRVFRVVKVKNTTAILDGNHPLAGQDLTFDIEVKETREATATDKQIAIAEHAGEESGDDDDGGDAPTGPWQ